ncbi:arginase family protein [Candidatus Pacearchaeota archaeon]|nr:arginase family protein [Candidatus Pacearchaeota archaeon]
MEIIRVRFIEKAESEGCESAPTEILKHFKNIECKENGDRIEKEKITFEEIHVDLGNQKESEHLIFENSKESFEKNFRTFFIGGDTSINFPLINAFFTTEKNPLVLVFDAHCGCSNSELMNKNWIKRIINEGEDGRKIVLIGPRCFEDGEKDFLKEHNILCITNNFLGEDLEGICDSLMERSRNSSGFLIILDMDFIDPAFAPGVNKVEPGGLSTREMIYFVKRLRKLENFRGAGILGINPSKDLNNITTSLGARVLAEFL